MTATSNLAAYVAVAPMMDWTDRHCRYFHRLIAPSAHLYTEMVTAAAICHGDSDRLLAFDAAEQPVAIQLGGSDPELMADAARRAEAAGYGEININVGCPSDRVQSGAFGACLMATPRRVADCVEAMRKVVSIPVTVKSRIGIDDRDDEAFLFDFIDIVKAAGCDKFIVHARVAILDGLSPKENREIPPLNYERVYALKQRHPDLMVVLNGGIKTREQAENVLRYVDGVMVGREAYQNPYVLTDFEHLIDPGFHAPARESIVERMLPYIDDELSRGTRLQSITRHMLGLFAGQPGARAWRRWLSERAHRADAGVEVIESALLQYRSAA